MFRLRDFGEIQKLVVLKSGVLSPVRDDARQFLSRLFAVTIWEPISPRFWELNGAGGKVYKPQQQTGDRNG